ncbi:hypothetical protein NKH18_29905 [Streptomyces sp. M10(2022)]
MLPLSLSVVGAAAGRRVAQLGLPVLLLCRLGPASFAVLRTAGRTRVNHASSSASRTARTISNHLGSSGSCANSPGRVPAGPAARPRHGPLALRLRGDDLEWPGGRGAEPDQLPGPNPQARLRGLARLQPPAFLREGEAELLPGCLPLSTRSMGAFPRFCTEVRNRAPSQPLRRPGSSLARSSRKGSTTTVISGTATNSGCSVGRTRMPRGTSPALTSWDRGGASRTVTVSEVPG